MDYRQYHYYLTENLKKRQHLAMIIHMAGGFARSLIVASLCIFVVGNILIGVQPFTRTNVIGWTVGMVGLVSAWIVIQYRHISSMDNRTETGVPMVTCSLNENEISFYNNLRPDTKDTVYYRNIVRMICLKGYIYIAADKLGQKGKITMTYVIPAEAFADAAEYREIKKHLKKSIKKKQEPDGPWIKNMVIGFMETKNNILVTMCKVFFSVVFVWIAMVVLFMIVGKIKGI